MSPAHCESSKTG